MMALNNSNRDKFFKPATTIKNNTSVKVPSYVCVVFDDNKELKLCYDSVEESEIILKDIHQQIISGLRAKIYRDCEKNPLLIIFNKIYYAYAMPDDD
jgi:hypothetical protein